MESVALEGELLEPAFARKVQLTQFSRRRGGRRKPYRACCSGLRIQETTSSYHTVVTSSLTSIVYVQLLEKLEMGQSLRRWWWREQRYFSVAANASCPSEGSTATTERLSPWSLCSCPLSRMQKACMLLFSATQVQSTQPFCQRTKSEHSRFDSVDPILVKRSPSESPPFLQILLYSSGNQLVLFLVVFRCQSAQLLGSASDPEDEVSETRAGPENEEPT